MYAMRFLDLGNVCAYHSDLLAVKAFEGRAQEYWGGEDLELLHRFVKQPGIRIVRYKSCDKALELFLSNVIALCQVLQHVDYILLKRILHCD